MVIAVDDFSAIESGLVRGVGFRPHHVHLEGGLRGAGVLVVVRQLQTHSVDAEVLQTRSKCKHTVGEVAEHLSAAQVHLQAHGVPVEVLYLRQLVSRGVLRQNKDIFNCRYEIRR